LVLYYFGDFNKITEKAAAVVGTRHNTLYGKLTTENLVQFLSNNQISVISGLAYGIAARVGKAD
jgi:DNA processing protein